MKPTCPAPAAPYWTLFVLAALIAVPFSWATAALVAALVGQAGWQLARRAAHARADRATRLAAGAVLSLGADQHGREVLLSDRQLAAHGLIVGASGAGKSTTLLKILCDRVARGLPVVAIDLKGSPSFARELEGAAARAGRPFHLWTFDGPSCWNPLGHGSPTELKDKLVATERFTEPHYQRAAERYVQTALQVLHAHGRKPTLADVVAMMEPRRLAVAVRGLDPALRDRVQDYVAGLTTDQLSAVRGLGTRLAVVSESDAAPYLAAPSSPDSIDLSSALEGPEVVLFSLNSSVYGQLASQIGTLAIQDLVSATGHRLQHVRSPVQATVAVDEFSALGGDHLLALVARGREAGVSVLLATQELADLDRAARGFRDQVLGQTAVKIAHRQDVPASAQTIAELAGTETVWERTRQIRSPLATTAASRGTLRQVEQFVVHPNEVKRLRTGEAVLLTKLPVANVSRVRIFAPQGANHAGAGVAARTRHAGIERGDQPEPGVTR